MHPATAPSVRIGATGHRILTDTGPVFRGVDEALSRIEAGCPGRSLVVLSLLAEGADRIVAEAVLRRPGSRLIAVLPFHDADYTADFGPDGSPSRVHYASLLARASEVVALTGAATRADGYGRAGRYLVDHCDFLLAVWDGRPAQGQGGTAEIVARAREQERPVVIVRAGNRCPGSAEPTSLGPEQGRVLLERLDSGVSAK